jgi:predicted metal-dependent peptidase
MNVLEQTICQLIRTENYFYSSFLSQCNRIYDSKLPAAAGISVTTTINLYINPTLFDQMPLNVRIAVLKHEILHLLNGHTGIKEYAGLSRKQINIAMDTAINQSEGITEAFATYPQMQIFTLENFRKACSKFIVPESIKANGDFHYYANIIKQCQDKFDESGADLVDDHDKMDESQENTSEEFRQHVIKKAAQRAKDAAGNVTGDLSILLDQLFKSKVNWKEKLRRFSTKTLKSDKSSTRRRINRRYGLMSPGKKTDYKLHIGFVLDVSGSMNEEWLAQGFAEMRKILDSDKGVKITLIEADTEVKMVKEFTKKTKPEITGRGGTALDCGFEKAKEIGVDAVICFTDGDFYEKLEDLKVPTLFAIIGRESWQGVGFGEVIYIKE